MSDASHCSLEGRDRGARGSRCRVGPGGGREVVWKGVSVMVNSRFPGPLTIGKSGKSGVGLERSLASLGGWCLGSMGLRRWEGWGVSGGRRIACCGEGYSPWGCTGSTGRAGCHDLSPNSRFLSNREIGN